MGLPVLESQLLQLSSGTRILARPLPQSCGEGPVRHVNESVFLASFSRFMVGAWDEAYLFRLAISTDDCRTRFAILPGNSNASRHSLIHSFFHSFIHLSVPRIFVEHCLRARPVGTKTDHRSTFAAPQRLLSSEETNK